MSETAKRDRSPSFPYITVTRAVQRIEVLFAKVKRHDARVGDIARDWGLAPKSSSTDRNVAALLAYGLVEDAGGSGETRKIKISEIGWRILEDGRPGVREELLSKIAIRPKIIREYAARWKDGRPDDDHAISQLKFEGNFTDDGARMFLRVYDDALRFAASGGGEIAAESEGSEVESSASGGSASPPVVTRTAVGSASGMATAFGMSASTTDNDIKIMLDGDRLRVSAFVDLRGAKRLVKALRANMALLEDEDEEDASDFV